jgi:hypothetical protein
MFSLATIKALQIYGIAIVISMAVAVLIKVLVVITSRVKREAKVAVVTQKTAVVPAAAKAGIPDDVVAALSAAIAVIAGPHRILHIGESKRSWANEGRIAQHSHQPRH